MTETTRSWGLANIGSLQRATMERSRWRWDIWRAVGEDVVPFRGLASSVLEYVLDGYCVRLCVCRRAPQLPLG